MAVSRTRWLVIGGGRWGRVLTDVLDRTLPIDCDIAVASRHNRPALEQWLSARPSDGRKRIHIASDLDAALADRATQAVIVANRPADHGTTVQRALAADKHVFVEKPFTLDLAEAESLVHEAGRRGRVLVIGLEYLFASYLHSLRTLLDGAPVATATFEWFDPAVEYRHGELKKMDRNTPILHDVLPHVWSVLRIVLPQAAIHLRSVSADDTQAELVLVYAGGSVAVRINRNADRRVRRLQLATVDGRTIVLDFSVEPGKPMVNGAEYEKCADWERSPSPVAGELAAFRSAIVDGIQPAHAAAACLGSVRLAVEAERQSSGTTKRGL